MPSRVLGLKPFWAGIFCAVLGAAALYFGRGLAVGTMKAPGPGAFPLILSLSVLLFGAAQLLRAIVARSPEDPPRAPLWRSPLAMAAGVVAILAAGAAVWGPASPYFTSLGAGPLFAWYALVLALAAAAAMLAPGGTPGRALGAVLAGLLLGLSGMDPLDKIERFASVDAGIWVNFVHGLFLAIVAYHIGFNALLMAAAAALAVPIETALRQGLAGAEGSISFVVGRPMGLALLVAAIAIAGAAVWLGRNQRARDAAPMKPPEVLARPAFWAGALALAAGGAGLYFGRDIGVRGAAGLTGAFGPGGAPMALSAVLMVLGIVQLAAAILRPAAWPPPPAPLLARAPATIGAIVLIAVLAVLLIGSPIGLLTLEIVPLDFLLTFGPAEIVAFIVFILVLFIAAAWLLPQGSLLRAACAICIGLLLSTVGLDVVTGVVRYAAEFDFLAAHGLALGFVAYRVGFNPLLIGIGFLYGEKLETSLRQALLVSKGNLGIFADRPTSLAFLLVALAVLAAAALLRWWQARLAGTRGAVIATADA